ncbi:mitotic interactor and substrate of PLK1 [Hemicordylus capensis]|uniref:mitotic interactor and substrate of PLK1 n=1 Tax=Hemicordylus capensis TaxID=884348 RepID=UPI0023045252|nr:mitotic interactor and substrate of PLK1 [Hemicordylus capensis]
MEPGTGNLPLGIPPGADPQYEGQNGHEARLRGELSVEVQGVEYLDIGHHNEKARNGWRTNNPSEDGTRWALRSVNGQKDLWTPSPDREANLAVVKSGSLYDIRAYKGEKKPSRLYDEDEEELRYKVPSEDASPRKVEDLEGERQEVIRSQVVRKRSTMAERWSSTDELETVNTASPSRDPTGSCRSYSTGFAVCFDNPSLGWVSTPVDPESIDTEQINFAAARQQFLALEKSNPKLLLGPRRQGTSPRSPAMKNICENPCRSPVVMEDSGRHSQRGFGSTDEKVDLPVARRKEPASHQSVTIYQMSSGENLDSDMSKAPHELSVMTADGRVSRKKFGNPLDSVASGQDPREPEASEETPIEREIRLSWEREEELWKERGIQRAAERDEVVAIQSKPLLLSSVSSLASSRKGKDKACISFCVQREIEQEIKREEDLQKEGRLLGTYDKGTRQQLGERRKVFEHEEAGPSPPCQPKISGLPPESSNGEPAPEQPGLHSSTDFRERGAKQAMKRIVEVSMPSLASHPSDPGPEHELAFSGQSSSKDRDQMDSPKPSHPRAQKTAGPEEKLGLQKEHFAIPIWKAKFSFSDDQGSPSTAREDPRPEWAAPREELYTLKTWRPRTSALIDQEIQEALEREVELQEQRRKARVSLASDGNRPAETVPCSQLSSQSSAASGVVGCYSVSGSPVFTPGSPVRSSASSSPDRSCSGRFSSESDLKTHQSLTQRPLEDKKRGPREEGKYAGIEPSDEIDTEVVKSTRAVRRRGLRAQLWESGQISRIGDEED